MLQLYFTNQEMTDFLTKLGYKVKSVKSLKSYNTYHNQVEDSCFDFTVAYKEVNKFTDPNEKHMHRDVEKFGLQSVFTNEIKLKLLNL